MLTQSLLVLAASILSSVGASSEFCLQGCCGLAFKLPSTSLTLYHLTIDKSSVQVPLLNPEITCCPCDNHSVQPQALLQPMLSVNNDTGSAPGPISSNVTTASPILPPRTKPEGPVHNSPLNGAEPSPEGPLGNPCPQFQCWSDCDCAPGIPRMDSAVPKAASEQVPLSIHCPQGQCRSDCACAPGMTPTDQTIAPKTDPHQKPSFLATGEVCAQGQCHCDCDCADGLTPTEDCTVNAESLKATSLKAASTQTKIMLPCPEGQCFPDCECSVDGLLAFINPGTPLASMPRVCPAGECSTDCICRDDLVKTAQVVASLKKHDSSSKLKKPVNQNVFTGKSEL